MTFPLTRSRSRARFFGTPFSPVSLFANGEQGAWYDPSDPTTLFQDAAGTTPTVMETRVRLMLDKSQGGVGTNGAKRLNLLTYSEDFSNAAWEKFAVTVTTNTFVAPDGSLTADTLASANGYLFQQVAGLTANAVYTVSIYLYAPVAINGLFIRLTDTSFVTLGSGAYVNVTAGWNRFTVTDNIGANTTIRFVIGGANTFPNGTSMYAWGADLRLASEASTLPLYQPITASWVATMAGNHATAPSDASSPILRARYNLLEYSEDFGNAYWSARGSVTTNAQTAPNNTTTADKLLELASTSDQVIYNLNGVSATAAAYTVSIYLKAAERNFGFVQIAVDGATRRYGVVVDLSTGAVTATRSAGTPTGTAYTVTNAGNGWWRVSVTANHGSGLVYIVASPSNSGTPSFDSDGEPTYAGNSTSGIYIWGADLRTSSDAALNIPAYQSITTATSYDTNGFPPYLAFDGSDDGMSTASIDFTGTDKVTLFTGVSRLSSAVNQAIVELSSTVANNGTFLQSAGVVSPYDDYFARVNGNSGGSYLTYAGYAAPVSNVITNSFDIAGTTVATEISTRINGVFNAGTNPTGTAGTGNFGSYPLYVGARNNASLYFNGRIYSLIIRGAATTTPLIASTESWINQKMRGNLLPVDYNFLTTAGGDQLTTADGDPLYTSPIYP